MLLDGINKERNKKLEHEYIKIINRNSKIVELFLSNRNQSSRSILGVTNHHYDCVELGKVSLELKKGWI